MKIVIYGVIPEEVGSEVGLVLLPDLGEAGSVLLPALGV